jgi:tol-pal system protein YbgF
MYFFVFLGFSTLLVQCVATQQDMEYTNIRVRQMDTKMEELDKEIAKLKNVQVSQAEAGQRLDYQQSEILRLQGEIEEQTFLLRQIQEENQNLKKLLQSKIDATEQSSSAEIRRLNDRISINEEQLLKAQDRVTFAEKEIMAIKESRSMEAADRAREAAQRAREAEKMARKAAEREAAERQAVAEQSRSTDPKKIVPDAYKVDVSSQNITEEIPEKKAEAAEEKAEAKTETSPPAPQVSSTPTSYDKGLTLFKQKKYRDAYTAFADYLDKNPSGSQVVEARYYAAESLYEDKDYELAILEFQKVIVENPQHSLAPKALYKQGLSFEKIGDQETARIVYNKLVDTYPNSDETGAAKSKIDALKK